MDEDTEELMTNKPSFFDYITSISSHEKSQILNLFQYGGLSILPILVILKLMKLYVPLEDPFKSTTDILIEVVIQLVVIVLSFFLIHKLVVYLPTYSKVPYDKISLLSTILPLFFIMMSLDTKIAEKLNILFDRLLVSIGLKKEGMDDVPSCGSNTNRPSPTQNTIEQTGTTTILPQPPQMLGEQNSPLENRLIDGYPTSRDTNASSMQQMMPQGGDSMMSINDGPEAANSLLGSAFN